MFVRASFTSSSCCEQSQHALFQKEWIHCFLFLDLYNLVLKILFNFTSIFFKKGGEEEDYAYNSQKYSE
jgi:hypothetical protein